MKAENRNRFILTLTAIAMVAIAIFQYHSQTVDKQRDLDQDNRCANQAAAGYEPFKGDASCFRWQRKSDSPVPIEG